MFDNHPAIGEIDMICDFKDRLENQPLPSGRYCSLAIPQAGSTADIAGIRLILGCEECQAGNCDAVRCNRTGSRIWT